MKNAKLQPYKEIVKSLLLYFDEYKIDSIPRDNNRYADVMTSVISLTSINIKDEETILIIKNIGKPSHEHVVEDFVEDQCYATTSINVCEWYQDVFYYIRDGVVPIAFNHNAINRLKKLATKYVIIGNLLNRMYFDGTLLRCLMRYEEEMALHQAHDGECGGHFNAKFVYQKLLRLGYYWPTMLEDCELHVKKCKQYQMNAKLQPYPSHGLHSIVSPWSSSI